MASYAQEKVMTNSELMAMMRTGGSFILVLLGSWALAYLKHSNAYDADLVATLHLVWMLLGGLFVSWQLCDPALHFHRRSGSTALP